MRYTSAMVITIDGPAGSGKSTAARELARALGIAFLDTGATYRAVTLKALREGVDPNDTDALVAVAKGARIEVIPTEQGARVMLDGCDVTAEIRSVEVTENAHYVADSPPVREVLVALQRRLGEGLGSFVTEGRDQGSVVFPEADVKFYLDASPRVRAERRAGELHATGQ
ncbi:MAG: (d)CMP kinase, partial [Phycisphaerae bacterium]|nr:(d)CMP kinase [Phycisphaerae bacterium]